MKSKTKNNFPRPVSEKAFSEFDGKPLPEQERYTGKSGVEVADLAEGEGDVRGKSADIFKD